MFTFYRNITKYANILFFPALSMSKLYDLLFYKFHSLKSSVTGYKTLTVTLQLRYIGYVNVRHRKLVPTFHVEVCDQYIFRYTQLLYSIDYYDSMKRFWLSKIWGTSRAFSSCLYYPYGQCCTANKHS